MAINLPGDVAWVLNMMSFDWPEIDEDELRRGADMVRTFRSELELLIQRTDDRINSDVSAGMEAAAATSYIDGWTEARSTHMQQLLDVLDPAAAGVDIVAAAVEALKLKVIAELVITAAQLAVAAATAFLTLGASAAANLLIIAARKKAMEFATNVIIDEVIGQLLTMIIEPLMNAATWIIGALENAPVMGGAIAETMAFVVDYAVLESTASEIGTLATDQERAGTTLIQGLTSLQIFTS